MRLRLLYFLHHLNASPDLKGFTHRNMIEIFIAPSKRTHIHFFRDFSIEKASILFDYCELESMKKKQRC